MSVSLKVHPEAGELNSSEEDWRKISSNELPGDFQQEAIKFQKNYTLLCDQKFYLIAKHTVATG